MFPKLSHEHWYKNWEGVNESSPPPNKPGAAADPYAAAYRPNVAPPAYASPVTSPLRATIVPDAENHFRFELDR